MANAKKPRPAGVPPLVLGLLTVLFFALFFGLILGLVFYFLPFSENHLSRLGMLVLVVSTFLGSYRAARLATKKRLLTGLGVGAAVFFLVFLLSLAFPAEASYFPLALKECLYLLAAGGLGGIAGASF